MLDKPYEWNGGEDDVVGGAFGESLPDSLDWREKGFHTSAKNQKSCGSCYAFSIALSIEAQIFQRTGKLIELSEQQIVDCSGTVGNHGCGGGSLRNTLRYLETTQGLMRSADYPYTASVRSNLIILNPEILNYLLYLQKLSHGFRVSVYDLNRNLRAFQSNIFLIIYQSPEYC